MFNRQNSFSYVKKLAILLILSSQVAGNQFLISAADARVLTAQIGDLELQIEDPKEQADNLRKAGIEHLKAKRFAQAEDSLKRAWRIYRDIEDDFNIGLTLNDLGLVYRYQEDYRSSAAVYRQAITAFEKADYLQGQWATLYNFGVLSYQQGLSYPEQSREQRISFRRAVNLYDRALGLLEEFGACFSNQKLEEMESLTSEAKAQVLQKLRQFSTSTRLKNEQIKLISAEIKSNKQIDSFTACPSRFTPSSDGQSSVLVDDGKLFD